MLRKVDNAALVRPTTLLSMTMGKGWVYLQLGKQTIPVAKMTKEEFAAAEALQMHQACFVVTHNGRNYWKFQGRFHWDDENLNHSQVQALLVTRQQRRTAQVQRAEQIVAMGAMPRQTVRGAIPDDVKHFVWTRDGGACRTCGSGVELQFDHVIPVTMGGSSDPANLQILCGPCNRRKGARVTG